MQGEINVCAFIAGFEEMFDWSTTDRILRTDVEEYGVV
jgi:hypothetical protein